jgi:hypothetical protein
VIEMGDFERTFGAGADAASIIDGYSRASIREQRQNRFNERYAKKVFATFEEASDWSKNNSGKMFMRAPNGNGFIEG